VRRVEGNLMHWQGKSNGLVRIRIRIRIRRSGDQEIRRSGSGDQERKTEQKGPQPFFVGVRRFEENLMHWQWRSKSLVRIRIRIRRSGDQDIRRSAAKDRTERSAGFLFRCQEG